MPSTVTELFEAAGVPYLGAVGWGETVPEAKPGVYVVSFALDPSDDAVRGKCPLSRPALEELLRARPSITVDGDPATDTALAARLRAFWLPDEPVLYVGKASSIRDRVGMCYRTPLGAKRPHGGGWWLKTLEGLETMAVHFGSTWLDGEPSVGASQEAESKMISHFIHNVADGTQLALMDPSRPFPYANLEFPRGNRKKHRIGKATG